MNSYNMPALAEFLIGTAFLVYGIAIGSLSNPIHVLLVGTLAILSALFWQLSALQDTLTHD